MRKYAITFLAAIVLIAVLPASAQVVVEVIPPNPTTADRVTLRFSDPYIFGIDTVTRTGNHFRFDFQGCRFLCLERVDVPLGALPAGTYTYSIFIAGDDRGTRSFAVLPQPDVPALSPAAMLALCVMLVGTAWFAIART